jgi:hypothetical protein
VLKKLALSLMLLAGCGGGDEQTLTIYLLQRLGPEGPPGQIAPVLMPFERERREGMAAAWQAVLELRVGPSPDERAHGVIQTVDPETRLVSIDVRGRVATVGLAGREPRFDATAAIVYALTELEEIDVVRLRLDGRPCCKYTHAGTPVAEITRASYTGWRGEPCGERNRPDAFRCRG